MRFPLRRPLRVFTLAVLAGTLAATSASAAPSPVIGHVYINDNTAPTNTIAGFDRHENGTLTAMPGSPFTAGGAGSGATIGSQGALQIADHGRYLLALDAGSNQVSVLRIRHDGSLRRISGSPFASGGRQPISIAVHDHLVYVANGGAGGSDYTGFRLGYFGRLHALSGSTFALPDTAQPGDVLFNSTGTRLVGVRVNSSQIDSFTVGADGRLTAAAGSPFPAQGQGPFGSEFRPTAPDQLFISNAHGGTGNGSVSAFRDGPQGGLSSIGDSPFADLQTAPCWVEISHDGRFLFTVNTGSSAISRYAIAPGGSLTLIGSTPLRGGPTGSFDARLAPAGRTLWVVDNGLDAVTGFDVDGSVLTELGSSPTALPAGATPFGIVVT